MLKSELVIALTAAMQSAADSGLTPEDIRKSNEIAIWRALVKPADPGVGFDTKLEVLQAASEIEHPVYLVTVTRRSTDAVVRANRWSDLAYAWNDYIQARTDKTFHVSLSITK